MRQLQDSASVIEIQARHFSTTSQANPWSACWQLCHKEHWRKSFCLLLYKRLNAVSIAESGRLKYNWANISSFCFTTEFIKRAKDHLEQTGQFHIARKKICSVLGPVQVSFQHSPWNELVTCNCHGHSIEACHVREFCMFLPTEWWQSKSRCHSHLSLGRYLNMAKLERL